MRRLVCAAGCSHHRRGGVSGLWQAVLLLVLATVACARAHAPVTAAKLRGAAHAVSAAPAAADMPTSVYMAERAALLAENDALGFAAGVHLSPAEVQLSALLNATRDAERTQGRRDDFFPPEHSFIVGKEHILASSVFAILRAMPKGGLLHVHDDSSMGDTAWLVKTGTYGKTLYRYDGETNEMWSKGMLWHFSAPPTPQWYRVVDLRAQSGNAAAFDASMVRNMSLWTYRDAFQGRQTWDNFQAVFGTISGVVGFVEFFPVYMTHFLELALADGLTYVEVRTALGGQIYDLDQNYLDAYNHVLMYQNIVRAFRAKHPEFAGMKLIYSGNRDAPRAPVLDEMRTVIALRKSFPDDVIGFDLVAEEDTGHTTLFYLADFLTARADAHAAGVTLPFFFHDGETLEPTNLNLFDALLLNTTRVGHGFALPHFPALLERVKRTQTAIEVCPISNQVLKLVHDLRGHPARTMLANNVPVVIASDDPGVFDYGDVTVSFDWYMAYMAWGLDLRGLKQLAINSLTYTSMSSAQRAAAMAQWECAWDAWVTKMLNTYGESAGRA